MFTFKARHGLTSAYIPNLLIAYEPPSNCKSSGSGRLVIPESRLKPKVDRAFAIRAPKLWNNLPEGSLCPFLSLV